MTQVRYLAGIVLAATLATAPMSGPMYAQTTSKRTPEQLKASYEAHKSDFDYLLGDWAFTSDHVDYGKFGGRWSAVRLETGQILDEYRVLGEQGETYYVSSTIRAYNAAADRWELIGMDSGGGLQDFGTAQRVNSEVHLEQRFGVASGKAIILRIRYYNIEPDRFSWSADRSKDNGRTWTKDFQHIEARRIGPSREMGPLTSAKKF
jgi:hypothetical protein